VRPQSLANRISWSHVSAVRLSTIVIFKFAREDIVIKVLDVNKSALEIDTSCPIRSDQKVLLLSMPETLKPKDNSSSKSVPSEDAQDYYHAISG
jgi:hypothetical protein